MNKLEYNFFQNLSQESHLFDGLEHYLKVFLRPEDLLQHTEVTIPLIIDHALEYVQSEAFRSTLKSGLG